MVAKVSLTPLFAVLLVGATSTLSHAGTTSTVTDSIGVRISSDLSSARADFGSYDLKGNESLISVTGDNDLARVEQIMGPNGGGNFSDIIQNGNNNTALVSQNGNDNRVSISQAGSYNRAEVAQVGSGNSLALTQVGNSNQFFASQTGNNNTIIAMQQSR